MRFSLLLAMFTAAASSLLGETSRPVDYVDPAIGSEGLGRVFIGPATPFGMVRPGPDCTPGPNSGWLPMPVRVDGFAQTHVSGTGGGPKYGNILIQPFCGNLDATSHYAQRASETIAPGYYTTEFEGSGIRTEITTTDRASVYRFTYPSACSPALMVDAGFFLGETPVPDAREAQQFIGSEIEVHGDTAVSGYSRIRGGWNNGRAYTVYFYLTADRPFASTATWKSDEIMAGVARQHDTGEKTGALLAFAPGTTEVNVRVGISFISERKAMQNLQDYTAGRSFDALLEANRDAWNKLLERIELGADTPVKEKRMFYTALYHTMLMPSDRTGENPLWTDPGVPYFDDFYAIWDTYRTSSPLITLIAPDRERDIVNSLINIGLRDGFMPDARSGNANGRTQGGSNAEIVLADAYVKGLQGIDYRKALDAMLKDATVDPGAAHEAEGRGGLNEYLRLGYVPHGIPRAGNRTVEYSLCDFAIHQVAAGLARDSAAVPGVDYAAIADRYLAQSGNWKNLWRKDYEHDGSRGFIMPRSATGEWLDSIPFGRVTVGREDAAPVSEWKFAYNPVMFEGPWYTPWWSMFFYEASSWEYSLSMPHDVEGLIEMCGGKEAFEKRLDTFFDHGHYNVNNEPSFLTPCLYHWIGRPDRTADRVREIVSANFNDTPRGLPGNDDSGAMSSWLAMHMIGLYPNAGHDYYLIHSPLVESTTLHLANGRDFRIVAENFGENNPYVQKILLNGKPHESTRLSHADLMAGGELRMVMGKKGGNRNRAASMARSAADTFESTPPLAALSADAVRVKVTYTLHGQKRRFIMTFTPADKGGLLLDWTIERNLKWWKGTYRMSREAREDATRLCYVMPEDGNHIQVPGNALFGLVSEKTLHSLLTDGHAIIDGRTYTLEPLRRQSPLGELLVAVNQESGSVMEILNHPSLPLVWSMEGNPAEINWTTSLPD